MEFLSSFFDNIKEKTTNPFFGTLIFVWLVRNWELVFTLFNFDKDCTLENKKAFIQSYYYDKKIWEEILINIGIALALMLLAYLLIIISRVIVNITNHNITPRLNELTVSKLVVNKTRFETVRKSRDEYFTKIEELGETIIGLEQKNSLFKTDNIKLQGDVKQARDESERLIQKNIVLQETYNQQSADIERIKAENEKLIEINKSEYVQKIITQLHTNLNIPKKVSETYVHLSNEKAMTFLTVLFDSISKGDNNENQRFNDLLVDILVKYGVVSFKDKQIKNLYNGNNIIITDLGYQIHDFRDVLSNALKDII